MHILASKSITIDRNSDDIFEYVSNMENFGEWFQGVLSIESENNDEHGKVGKTYMETVKIPLRGTRKIKLKVVESIKPQMFITEGNFPPLLPRMEISITSSGESSKIDWKMYSRNSNFLFKTLLLPLVKNEVSKRAQVSLKRLKSHLEKSV